MSNISENTNLHADAEVENANNEIADITNDEKCANEALDEFGTYKLPDLTEDAPVMFMNSKPVFDALKKAGVKIRHPRRAVELEKPVLIFKYCLIA